MDALSGPPVRRILRFGQPVDGEAIQSIPPRYRGDADGSIGKLRSALLRPAARQAWLRLSQRSFFSRRKGKGVVIALSAAQPADPPDDAIELRGGAGVHCHDGYVGRLDGLAVDARTGGVLDLLVRVRGDVLTEVDSFSSPFRALEPLAGQEILVSPTWIVPATAEKAGAEGDRAALHLDATLEQIASATVVRGDGDLASDIWRILEDNPAITPHLAEMDIAVHDGDVTLRGAVPTPRHRASAEQDVWHVPGVFAVRNELEVTS